MDDTERGFLEAAICMLTGYQVFLVSPTHYVLVSRRHGIANVTLKGTNLGTEAYCDDCGTRCIHTTSVELLRILEAES